MQKDAFQRNVKSLFKRHEKLIQRENERLDEGDGILDRFRYPVLTGEHTPVFWR
jgi:4-O-beta-D-mannosyl-D-glucose phosphorylase